MYAVVLVIVLISMAYAEVQQQSAPSPNVNLFAMIDADGDGFLTRSEVKSFLSGQKDPDVSEEKLDLIFTNEDKDKVSNYFDYHSLHNGLIFIDCFFSSFYLRMD